MMSKKYWVIGFFFLATLIRVGYVVSLGSELVWPDEHIFTEIAHGISQGRGYVSDPYRAAPGLPFLLALVFTFFGKSYVAARIFYSIVGGLTVAAQYLICERVFDRRTAIIASILLTFYPPHIYLSGVLIVGNLLSFGLVGFLFFCVRFVSRPGVIRAVWLGFWLGLVILVRPIALVLLPTTSAVLILFFRQKRMVSYTVLFICAAFLTILPWTLRNQAVFHERILISTGFGFNLWAGNNELSEGNEGDRLLSPFNSYWEARLQRLPEVERVNLRNKYETLALREEGLSRIQYDKLYGSVARDYILRHPGLFLERIFLRLGTFLKPVTETATNLNLKRVQTKVASGLYMVYALMALGHLLFISKTKRQWIVYLPLASITLTYSLMLACTRFRLPLDPLLIILAAAFLTRVMAWSNRKDGVT